MYTGNKVLVTGPMDAKRGLGRYILAAFSLNVIAIVSVGGICILLVRDMARDISGIKRESALVSRIHDVNGTVQEAVFLVQTAVMRPDKGLLERAIRMVGDTRERVAAYQEEETGRRADGPELHALFGKILENLGAMDAVMGGLHKDFNVLAPTTTEALNRLEGYGYAVQNLGDAVNAIHFRAIEGLVDESNTSMYYILFLYLVSSMAGVVASLAGYAALERNVIRPVIDLASATERVARGDLSVRVRTGSRTEIGTLYSAFNEMIERLQEHDKRLQDFHRELEKKVEERTSELRASEASLRHAQDELVRMEKIATLGQIASTVNHEIKTPLNVLYMNLQLLQKKIARCGMDDGEAKAGMLELVSLINNEIMRINGILEEFVRYARFPAPEPVENDPNGMVKRIAEMIAERAKGAGVSVELKLEEPMGKAMLDDKKITQALLNLCVNAIQAMPRGGVLTVETSRQGDELVLGVSDTGTGIPGEDLERIFDPFFTKKKGGMGFGLAIVKRIVEDHGGRIECTSKEGEGTSFTIRLPMKKEG